MHHADLWLLHIPAQVIVELIVIRRADKGAVVIQLPCCWLTQLGKASQFY